MWMCVCESNNSVWSLLLQDNPIKSTRSLRLLTTVTFPLDLCVNPTDVSFLLSILWLIFRQSVCFFLCHPLAETVYPDHRFHPFSSSSVLFSYQLKRKHIGLAFSQRGLWIVLQCFNGKWIQWPLSFKFHNVFSKLQPLSPDCVPDPFCTYLHHSPL